MDLLRRIAGWLISGLLLAGLPAGCGSRTYPVRGQVVYREDGRPVPGGVVIWFEATQPPYERASGIVDREGNFYLSTVRDGSGALAGEHRIRFEPQVPYAEPNAALALAKIMDPRFLEFRTSGLVRTVSASGTNELRIEVEKPPRRTK